MPVPAAREALTDNPTHEQGSDDCEQLLVRDRYRPPVRRCDQRLRAGTVKIFTSCTRDDRSKGEDAFVSTSRADAGGTGGAE